MKRFLLTIVVIVSSIFAYGYKTSDMFNYDIPIAWVGLDFSHMHFIGQASQMHGANQFTSEDILTKYIPAWNDLFVNERDKYNVAEAVHHREVQYVTEITGSVNKRITRSFFTPTLEPLSENTITKLISAYDFKGYDGIGLLFFIDSMNKEREEVTMWVTFVDMSTKKVLMTKYMKGIARGGMGFRNHWAWAFYKVVEDMNHYWRKWKREYAN